MSNRDKLNVILTSYATGTQAQQRLYQECEYFRAIQTEDGPAHPDLAGALPDAERHADENADRAVLKAARKAQIEAGYFKPIDVSDVQAIGGRRSWFKLGGVAYDWHTRWDRWLDASA